MRRTVWLAGLALALAGIASWVLLSSGDADERGELGRGSRSASEARERSRPAELASAEKGAERDAPEALALSPGAGEDRRISTVESEDLVTVRLRPDGGLPAGERADVYVVTGSRARYDWDRPRQQLRKRARRGELYRSDLEGRVFVPPDSRPYVIAAETSLHWGFVRVEPEAREVDLPLASYPKLEVRVLDHAGDPAAGVMVSGELGSQNLPTSTTDANGIARWPDVQALLGEDKLTRLITPLYTDGEPRTNCDVELRGPFYGPHELSFPLWEVQVGSEPYELQLPPCGSIEVRLEHLDGRPWAVEKGALYLQTDIRGLYGEERPTGENRTTRYEFEGSSAVLPWVEAGRDYELRLSADGMTSDDALDVAGPTTPGERVVVRFHPAEAMRILKGRLVDDAGEPLGLERFELTLIDTEDRSVRSKEIGVVRTEADGRFHEQIPERWPITRPTTAELVWRKDPSRGVRVELPQIPSGEPNDAWLHDAGTVVLEDAPLIAAGVVQDAGGKGIRRARVRLYAVPKAGKRTRVAHRDLWTDRKGHFALHGWAMPNTPALLSVSHGNFVTKKVQVPLGVDDAVVSLVAVGSLVVEAILDDGVHSGELSAWYRLLEEDKRREMDRVYEEGEFLPVWRAEGVTPGTYQAGLDLIAAETQVASLGPVLVESEGAPQLTADLRGELHTTEIVCPSLWRVDSRAVAWREAGSGDDWKTTYLTLRQASIVSRTPAIDLEVSAYGFRRVSKQGVSGTLEIAPEPADHVRILLPDAAHRIGDKRCYFVVDDLDLPWDREGEILTFDARGEFSAQLGPGRYVLECKGLERKKLSEEFVVRDTEEEQVIVLERLAADIARSLSGD